MPSLLAATDTCITSAKKRKTESLKNTQNDKNKNVEGSV
jgi:hypothetical protein